MLKKWQPSVDGRANEATYSSNFNNLPREIMAEIMSRLPPESLMECKRLNKSCYFLIGCLIKNPEFVARHLHHAKSSTTTLLVYYHLHRDDPAEKSTESRRYELMASVFTSAPSCGNIRDNDDLIIEDLNLPGCLTGQAYESVYHCNGIICLTKDIKTITLCNLELRKLSIFHPETDLKMKYYRILGMGFGSNLGDDGYKIVRLLEPMKAEVFIPGATNSWREIGIGVNDKQYGNLESHVYFKGKCFWLMFGIPKMVLCFNVCSEVFQTIPLPNELNIFEGSCSRLTVRDDSICLFWYHEELESRNSIHVWEMDINSDGGHTYCWRKCLNTKSFDRDYSPLTFWRSDELLVDDEDNLELCYYHQIQKAPKSDTVYDRIISYNIRTQKFRKLHFNGTLGPICYSGPYVKSLVSIKEKKLA